MWITEATLPDYAPGGLAGKVIRKNQVSMGAFIILTIILALIFWNAAANTDTIELDTGGSQNAYVKEESWSDEDYTNEGQATEVGHQFLGRVNSTRFELTWTDDDTTEGNINGMGVQNQPDTFCLTIVTPNGTTYSEEDESDVGTEEGKITIDIVLGMTEKEKKNKRIQDFEAGNWNITVECVEAGDSRDNLGIIEFEDDGNAWTLTVTYGYWVEASEDISE